MIPPVLQGRKKLLRVSERGWAEMLQVGAKSKKLFQLFTFP
jgi:hypothetical protein